MLFGFLFQIIEKLSVGAPSGVVRLKVLKEIAQEYNIEWDSSKTEAEFSKKPEDLLVCVLLFLVSFLYTVILSFDRLPVICSVC